mmetsp:Transcript_22150/g.27817  ORF Transcript_22150/g.27817 Transcript_22150/m.27817 type:complete len:610 (+) Transcript_22150:306-2135(+)
MKKEKPNRSILDKTPSHQKEQKPKRRYSNVHLRSNDTEPNRRLSETSMQNAIEALIQRFYFEGDEFLLDVDDPEFFITDGPCARFMKVDVMPYEMKVVLDTIQERELELRKLIFSGTGTGAQGAVDFLANLPEAVESVVVEDDPRLSFLDNCDRLLKALAARKPSSLWHLSLRKNQLNPQCAQSMASVIRCRPQLQYLNLADNALNDSAIDVICDAFTNHSQLQKLVLQGNRLTDLGASTLATFASHHWDLTSLDVLDNLITRRGMATLQRAWSGRTPYKFLIGPAPKSRSRDPGGGFLPFGASLPQPQGLMGYSPKKALQGNLEQVREESFREEQVELDGVMNNSSEDEDLGLLCIPCAQFSNWFWRRSKGKNKGGTPDGKDLTPLDASQTPRTSRTSTLSSLGVSDLPGVQGVVRLKRQPKPLSPQPEPVATEQHTVHSQVEKDVSGMWVNTCYLTLTMNDPTFVDAISLSCRCSATYRGTETGELQFKGGDKLAFEKTWAEISLLDQSGQEVTHRYRLFTNLNGHGKFEEAVRVLDDTHPIIRDIEPNWKIALWLRSAIPGWEFTVRHAALSLSYKRQAIIQPRSPGGREKVALSDDIVNEAVCLL